VVRKYNTTALKPIKKGHISIPNSDIKIGNDHVFVIAEIGKNFIQSKEEVSMDEYLSNAKKLIDAAVKAGADAVKFQTHEVEDEQAVISITSPHFKGIDRHTWVSWNTRITPLEFWKELKNYADAKDILFFSTPMSRKAAIKLESLDVPFWKIGSGDVEDYVLLDYIAETKKPVIISTGMVGKKELERVVVYLQKRSVPLVVLYCVSKYPCSPKDFNLASIEYLKEKYPDIVVGFSDHNVSSHEVDLAAVKLGARVIEKHFSFDRNFWGSDHKASITPPEMEAMIKDLRKGKYESVDHTKFYGNKRKDFEGAKNQFREYFKKTLVASVDAKKGDIITKDMIYALRPQKHLKGLPSNHYHKIIGKKIKKDIKKYEPINKKHIA